MDSLEQRLKDALQITEKPEYEQLLPEVTFEGVARYILSDKCKNVVTMAGAGISTCEFQHRVFFSPN